MHPRTQRTGHGIGSSLSSNGCHTPRSGSLFRRPAPADVAEALSAHGYLPDEGLATAVFLALALQRPLLLEGEAGVGKTEVAKVLGRWTGGELIRLQCYEGIDASQAVYDWDYSRQLLHLRAAEATGEAAGVGTDALEDELYHERFLLKRAAAAGDRPPRRPRRCC